MSKINHKNIVWCFGHWQTFLSSLSLQCLLNQVPLRTFKHLFPRSRLEFDGTTWLTRNMLLNHIASTTPPHSSEMSRSFVTHYQRTHHESTAFDSDFIFTSRPLLTHHPQSLSPSPHNRLKRFVVRSIQRRISILWWESVIPHLNG